MPQEKQAPVFSKEDTKIFNKAQAFVEEVSQLDDSTTLAKLQSCKNEGELLISQLGTIRKKLGEAWAPEHEELFNSLSKELNDVKTVVATKLEAEAKEQGFKPKKGEEKFLHIEISRGQRFDPLTGKEITKKEVQLFSYPEWQVFKNNYKVLGYRIHAVLHNPFKDQVTPDL